MSDRVGRLVVPLAALGAQDLAVAGGKGANLGELIRAGFPVPEGFVITTEAYAAAAIAAGADPNDPAAARAQLTNTTIPAEIARAVRDAYRALGGLVAVRSSATAEDPPEASFAGQQDTILDVEGEDALLDAVRRCWASLWNERAVSYRATHMVDERALGLAVVVQRMVPARVAGVLFTADPITGRRRRAAIDAVRGFGEQLVSGAVNPDHYLVDTRTGAVLERRGDIVDDARLRELAAMGARIEAHYGRPQDIEWAIDDEKLWIVQSRDITTLYPIPASAPDPERDLRVYLSANVAQGVFQPFTPMGLQTLRLLGSASPRRSAGRSPIRSRAPLSPPTPACGVGSISPRSSATPPRAKYRSGCSRSWKRGARRSSRGCSTTRASLRAGDRGSAQRRQFFARSCMPESRRGCFARCSVPSRREIGSCVTSTRSSRAMPDR